MRVRMLQPFQGTVDGVRFPPVGGEFDVADAAAVKMIEKGQAEAVAAPEKREKATARRSEKRES